MDSKHWVFSDEALIVKPGWFNIGLAYALLLQDSLVTEHTPPAEVVALVEKRLLAGTLKTTLFGSPALNAAVPTRFPIPTALASWFKTLLSRRRVINVGEAFLSNDPTALVFGFNQVGVKLRRGRAMLSANTVDAAIVTTEQYLADPDNPPHAIIVVAETIALVESWGWANRKIGFHQWLADKKLQLKAG